MKDETPTMLKREARVRMLNDAEIIKLKFVLAHTATPQVRRYFSHIAETMMLSEKDAWLLDLMYRTLRSKVKEQENVIEY